MKEVRVGKIKIGRGNPAVLIAGPCVMESEASALRHARALKRIAEEASVPLIYKSSYDKANRSSISSFRGPGLKKGLKILKRVKEEVGIPVLSDVHCKEEIGEARKVLDVIQIPALLCRQTDLIVEAARTGRVINVKKGQFMAAWEMPNVIKKIESAGNRGILLTERGTTFGYNNLVSDFRSILIMRRLGYPVIYDASHSVQLPAGKGDRSGGEREFIPHLAMAAAACGADGIFIETHEDPDNAPCDGPNMMRMRELKDLLLKIREIENVVRAI
jgi:2-dehydro-3-deoxyphosphooctonate aldolase (KDO 8-P synthase)